MHDARLPDGDVELLEEELEEGEDARGEAEPLLSRNSSAVMDIQSLFIRGEVEPLLEEGRGQVDVERHAKGRAFAVT